MIDEIVTAAAKDATDEMGSEIGFDFTPLISLAIDLLTDWISGCMKTSNRAKIAEEIAGGGWRVRYLTRRAIRQSSQDLRVGMSYEERKACEIGILNQAKADSISKALDDIESISRMLMI